MASLFTPIGDTKNISAGTTTGSVALTGFTSVAGGSVRVHNAGSVTAFVRFGNSAITAVLTTAIPIPAGAVEAFELGAGCTHMAAITASSTATVYVTSGQGS